jgi:hypothetical protein
MRHPFGRIYRFGRTTGSPDFDGSTVGRCARDRREVMGREGCKRSFDTVGAEVPGKEITDLSTGHALGTIAQRP